VVERGHSTNSHAHGWSPVGSHHVRLALAPGESREVIFVLGYHENPRDDKFDPPGSQVLNKHSAQTVIQRYTDSAQVNAAFDALRDHWRGLLDKFQVDTPDLHTNRMVNIWNAYQCMVTFNMSRSASYFESGIGRGMGFRDSNQDLLGFVHMVPESARQRILDLAATQLVDGGAYHQYQTLTKRGNRDVGDNFNDDPLWLVLGVSAYIKETGDWSILDEPTPYENKPGSEQPLYDHLRRSIQYTLDRRGPHRLPLIGRADWNDCLNLNCFSETPGESFQTTTSKDGKVAESVMIAGLFVLAAHEMGDLAAQVEGEAQAAFYRAAADDLEGVVRESGWDGDWFRRAYDDFGQPVGSSQNEEGQIFIESQGVCVMAGIGLDDGRAARAIDSVHERLSTPHGIVLHTPAFTRYYLNLGEIGTYPPGYKENASVFCHTNPWIMISAARLGRGEQAHQDYLRINPSAREEISEVHRCEPYVYAQTIAGKDAPTHGEAKNSWLTGTAAWNYAAISQWILGVRAELDGLRIEPVIPESWNGFSARRIFRGVTYEINVQRRGAGNAVALLVNGVEQEGSLVAVNAAPGSVVLVEALIGAA